MLDKTGKHVEVMVYGDGAFKDPVGKIWELADPCVSPASTPGLEGTPQNIIHTHDTLRTCCQQQSLRARSRVDIAV